MPSSASKDKEVQEEMEELLADDDEESDCPPGISGSSDDESPPPPKQEATPLHHVLLEATPKLLVNALHCPQHWSVSLKVALKYLTRFFCGTLAK